MSHPRALHDLLRSRIRPFCPATRTHSTPHFPLRPHFTRSIYTYRLAISSSPKSSSVSKPVHGTNYISQSLTLSDASGTFSSNDRHSGEDAFFVSQTDGSSGVVLGVADGVGGWRDAGVDPGVFSHGLCGYMAQRTKDGGRSTEEVKPKALLSWAFEKVMADKRIAAGGSTATVASCGADGNLEVANLGDSGFAIFEPNKVAYTSSPQTHGFNTPYQLTKLTARMKAQQQIFGGPESATASSWIKETPSVAQVTSHKLEPGSVLVLATDGVWDNLDSSEILTLVGNVMTAAHCWTSGSADVDNRRLAALPVGDGTFPTSLSGFDETLQNDVASRLAFSIMHRAKTASLDHKRDGPFAREAKRYYPKNPYHGGKVDDITVVVAIAVASVEEAGDSQSKDSQPLNAKL